MHKKIAKQIRTIAKGESSRDAKQFRELARIVATGDMKKAWKYYSNMDGFNREAIHGEVMSFLYVNRTKGKKIVPVRVTCGDELIHETELVFPSDASDTEMARAICNWESEKRGQLLNFEYGDIKRKRG